MPVCIVCCRVYKTIGSLRVHRSTYHTESFDCDSYTCHTCPKSFPRRDDLFLHNFMEHFPVECCKSAEVFGRVKRYLEEWKLEKEADNPDGLGNQYYDGNLHQCYQCPPFPIDWLAHRDDVRLHSLMEHFPVEYSENPDVKRYLKDWALDREKGRQFARTSKRKRVIIQETSLKKPLNEKSTETPVVKRPLSNEPPTSKKDVEEVEEAETVQTLDNEHGENSKKAIEDDEHGENIDIEDDLEKIKSMNKSLLGQLEENFKHLERLVSSLHDENKELNQTLDEWEIPIYDWSHPVGDRPPKRNILEESKNW